MGFQTNQAQFVPQVQPLVLVNLQEYNLKTTLPEKKEYLGNLIYDFIEQRYSE